MSLGLALVMSSVEEDILALSCYALQRWNILVKNVCMLYMAG